VDGPSIYIGDPENEFQWLSEEDLRMAKVKELVEEFHPKCAIGGSLRGGDRY
jgi:hypothetical protein